MPSLILFAYSVVEEFDWLVLTAQMNDESDGKVSFLISRDTMATFRHCGEVGGVWKLVFLELNANIESEKWLVGPDYEHFVHQVCAGRMGVS